MSTPLTNIVLNNLKKGSQVILPSMYSNRLSNVYVLDSLKSAYTIF